MILYLAQIGSFVPAESVYFTPVDQIHVVCSSTEVGAGTVSRCGFVFSRVRKIQRSSECPFFMENSAHRLREQLKRPPRAH